ncbi:hypothetical protein K474DRAFT_1683961 [Panus rudis PR-1116 ss-1]|nr:hypothetical protein K474DRAFT_1683961 [Panus rudis PR-1116 ss-1]
MCFGRLTYVLSVPTLRPEAEAEDSTARASADATGTLDAGVHEVGGWEDIDPVTGMPQPPSHADEVFLHALRDLKHSNRGKSWRERRTAEFNSWLAVMDDLVQSFVSWKYGMNANTMATAGMDASSGTPYTIEVYDLWTLEQQKTILRPPESVCPALDFALHGYLTRSALSPSIAISFRTLEHYHVLRSRKPSFSAEAFAKVLCDSYNIPFHRYLAAVVADTYEIFLTIIRRVEKQVFAVLGWDTPEWRACNACRACCYELEDEPELRFSRLWAFDGNNSLKRMAANPDRVAGDTRVYTESDYFLPREFVDRFAHEVKSRRTDKGPQIQPDMLDDDVGDGHEPLDPIEGDPTDGSADDKGVEQCVKNWKSAASEDKKKAWGIFDETGIFASACRHGLILWLVDMVKSGELAKYPLAIVAKVIDVFKRNSLCGYDIGCKFGTTVLNSSLGPRFKEMGHMFCVNAFHGYTHSYECQVKHHPNVTVGIGLEDLETLERVFSSSNQLASTIRYASLYRRRQLIDAYFRQWDEDKYANLEALASTCATLHVSESDLDRMAQEEKQFFMTVGQERPWDVYAVAYVELLQQLRQLEADHSISAARFYGTIPSDYRFTSTTTPMDSYSSDASSTARLERRRRKAIEEYDRVLNLIIDMEVRMNIAPGERWTETSPQYISTIQYLNERHYQRALAKVQKLVISRLFELHKLNLAQTGYKLRTHLAKSLQKRCKTIRKAVAEYNLAAAKLSPPRPPLDWSEVSHYGFLEEFLLLQDTRNDIRNEAWAKDGYREAIKLRRHVQRAEEEIQRCNVEVRCLHTAIRDEAVLFSATLEELRSKGSPMFGPVQDFVTRRMRINDQLLGRIEQIYSIPGFSGTKGPGVRIGSRPLPLNIADPSQTIDIGCIITAARLPPLANDVEDDSDIEDDDELQGDIAGIDQYMSILLVS